MIDAAETRVVDCDWHYMDSFTELAEYMPEPWKTKYQNSEWDSAGVKQNVSSFFPTSTGDRQNYGKITREHSNYPTDPEEPERIREGMEFLDVDDSLQISHLALAMGGVTADDERVQAFAKGYVEYMREEVLDPEDGVYGLAMVPYDDVEASLEVLERVEDDEAFVGACFVTAGATPPLGNRKYDPIYERCEEMDFPIVYHTGGSGLDEYVRAGYQEMIETHTLGFLESNMSQIVSVACQGVPEKFPDLDIVFMESGVTYIPGLVSRLDEEYLKRPEEAPLLDTRPGEYITDFYFGTQPLERIEDPEYFRKSLDTVGIDRFMFASDFPHWDYDPPSAIDDLGILSTEETEMLLGRTAEEVFGI